MKASEMRDMGLDDLTAKSADLKQELFNLRFQHGTGQLENTSRLKATKQDIARAKTIIRELTAKQKSNNQE